MLVTLYLHVGDAHLYLNHIEQAEEQLSREPLKAPKVYQINSKGSIDEFDFDDFKLIDYQFHPHIPAKVAVID